MTAEAVGALTDNLAARIVTFTRGLPLKSAQSSQIRGDLLRTLIRLRVDLTPILRFDSTELKDRKFRIYYTGADFSEADLRSGVFVGANIPGINLTAGHLAGADFSKATLVWSKMTRANLSRARLCEANMAQVELNEANLSEADIAGADLEYADLRGARLENLRGWRTAKLDHANIYGVAGAPVGFIDFATSAGAVISAEPTIAPANE